MKRERHPELQAIQRELQELRRKNRFGIHVDHTKGLLFAEAAVTQLLLERLLRALLDPNVADSDTPFDLLQRAASLGLLRLPWEHHRDALERLRRGSLLHGDYEHAARESGCASAAAFLGSRFPAQVDALYRLTEALLRQVEPTLR